MTTSLREEIIQALNVSPRIDPEQEIRRRIDFLKSYTRASGTAGFVLGISGGQDSSLAGRLAQLAAEELRAEGVQARFRAVRLPYGTQHDEDDAQLALTFIQPDESIVFNVAGAVDGLESEYARAMNEPITDFNKGNAKARSRMMAQYAIAGEHKSLVIGTDHAAEAVTGFFTKYGDGGADVLPLSGLTKRQGGALLQALGAPERLWTKPPTADLLDATPGQSDETELGIGYADIDDYLEGKEVPAEVAEAIEARYVATRHKRELPATLFDSWWQA
ncbi:ammonia-dependent NAD(+) synthetase [Sediminivirga luteola]|uniref:ammonia-dependent NAD(+) synthetase n=1 Tax=Sediminivirga luteola TaxID=1774748 RepID=UPI001F59FCA8|nr:ammonia-dependent NAD(+) synthetase [Sediminivirga luteola]MCI2264216.1 ammonia-dependent NAD(+) synthetase [Sediminivirga luteola]